VGYNCVVLVKQVPDTKRITGEVMNDDGTVKRSALPAIFNPEDLNALELALQIKDKFGGHITVITMGLPAAGAILRDSLFRGADDAILLTDPRCAASDTLATSYILSCAVKKLLKKGTKTQRYKGTETQSTNHESRATSHDIVLCGRQAIDGDTAQVGPQLAEKLGVPQITYVEELIELAGRTITAQRNIGNGWQQVKTTLPVLLTVTGEANEPRVAAAKKIMKYKIALAPCEIEQQLKTQNPTAAPEEIKALAARKSAELEQKGVLIKQWNLDSIGADLSWCGQSGSPTKVHRIQSVVLAAKESKAIEPTQNGIASLVHELIEDKIIA
jgi:electron transfer flavoprotein beta subunit